MGEMVNMQPQSTEGWVDVKEVANHFKVDTTYIRRLAKTGRIPALMFKNGSRNFYRFRIEEVEAKLREGCA